MRAIAVAIVTVGFMLGYKLDLLFAPSKYTSDERKLLGGTLVALMVLDAILIGFGL